MTTVGSGRPSAASTGTPQEIAIPDEPLTAALDRAAQRWPERVAVDFLGAPTTYRELADAVARGAQVLLDLGVRPGDRVALVMPNCTGHVIAFYAALRIGAVVVEHNPTYTAGELAHQLADSGAVVALVWEKAVPRVLESLPRTALKAVVAVDLSADLPRGKRLALRLPGAERAPGPGRDVRKGAARLPDVAPARRQGRTSRPGAPGAVVLRRRPAAVHRRDDRHAQGRDAHAPQPGRERGAGPRLDRRRARHRRRLRGPAVLPRLRPDPVPELRDPRRRHARRVPVLRPRAGARRTATPPRDVPPGGAADARPARGRRRGVGRRPHVVPLRDLRRDGPPAAHRAGVGAGHRRPGDRGVRDDRDVPGRAGQPADGRAPTGHARAAVPQHQHPRRRPGGRHARRRARRARASC